MTPQFEFNSTQNELIQNLGQKMRFVSFPMISMGVFSAIIGIFELLAGGLINIITGVTYILMGIWTYQAAKSFGKIVDTQGYDIDNLMTALDQLRRIYALQYWLIIIAIIFLITAQLLVMLLRI
jgi:hypothetical protein